MEAEERYLRMNKSERIQHFLLLCSFMVLVVTGFALKFPEAWWVRIISAVIGENAFEARGIVHRVASIVMIVASVYHLYYVSFTVRGRQLIKDFFPTLGDITEFRKSMSYLIGKNSDKPLYGRFSYIEKMEYWAVVWGTVIMGATGFVLWFKDFFFKLVGNVGMDIATAIHYYEAILASLAILVWHFYYVFVNPDVRPMNKAWLSGYLTKEEMEKEHPMELKKLAEEETSTKEEQKEV